jgi:23S rRNA (uracil1939-C5)-methyltransferase
MKPSNRSHPTFKIEIEKLVFGGSGLGRHRGKVVFVPFSAPGDRLLVRAVREKKDYIRGEIERILEPGPGRVDPVCRHFGKCGGCHWQHLEYPLQVKAKLAILKETLNHLFPQTRDIPIDMKACAHPFGYRSRARVQLRRSGSRISAGFFRPGSHTVEAIEDCPLLRPPLNQAINALKRLKSDTDTGIDVQEFDIAGSYEEDLWTAAPAGSGDIAEAAYSRTGNDVPDKKILLKRMVGEFRYSVAASVFFQANDFMVPELVRLVLRMAEDKGRSAALDLYSGVGLFSLPLSGLFESVVAIENSPSASGLCYENARAASIERIQTICSDATEWMRTVQSGTVPGFDLILLDPPRSGAGAQAMEQIRLLAPRTILYVSCDPQTLGRDLFSIPREEYRIDRVEGLDMFPQTYHFETVIRLVRN